MDREEVKKKIFGLAECLVKESDGEIRLAFHEADESKTYEGEAAHFLKHNEKRIGRDLELYAFMSEVAGIGDMLTRLLQEVLWKLKEVVSAYGAAMEYMKLWGLDVFPEKLHKDWESICNPSEQDK